MNSNRSVDSSILKPQLLFSIPSNLSIKTNILNNQFLFAFPNGIDFSNYEEVPKIYPVVLTNEKGIHSYLYILLFYDKISELPESKNNITRNSNILATEMQYCPISIIIASYYSNVDFFKELLKKFYKIIRFDSSIITNYCEKNNIKNNGNNIDVEKIKLFQKLELFNYLNFCYEILRPPNKSILNLNMRFDKIKYKFQSLTEIPTSDYCMDVLFNSLEISVIIKLYIALLFEKHIIIIANQNMPLFCICESIQRLLFPFRWLHPYVPNLPYDQIDYLDSPLPYLIGINSSKTCAQDLNMSFPSHIICEVGTSTLYGNVSNLKLPINEEMKIKTKLLLLKSKYKNNYDEFDIEGCSSNSSDRNTKLSLDEYEDVDFKLSFAQNVQNIFFRIFKNNLMNIKKEYITNNVFNSQKFLNSFDDEEYKLFFEKIINTLAFEYFVQSMKYLDNSLSRQFNLIYNYADKKLKGKVKEIKYYNYSFNIPKKLKNENELYQKDQYVSSLFDNYNEISSIIEENMNKFFRNSESNNSDYSKSKSSSEKNIRYNILHFYGKNGFISFAQNYKNIINYKTMLFDETLNIYKDSNSFHDIDQLMDIIESPLLTKYTHTSNNNKNEINKINTNEIEKVIDVPKTNCYQFYIIIALYLYYFMIKYNAEKKNGNYIISKNCKDTIADKNQFQKTNKNSLKLPSKNKSSSNKEIMSINYKGIQINNKIIFELFVKAFRKNQEEFPRNLFFMILNIFSLDELVKIGTTNLKYIDKTVQCQIRKIKKISYKTLVISNDSDLDDMIPKDNEKGKEKDKDNKEQINMNFEVKKISSGELDQIQAKFLRKGIHRRKTGRMLKNNFNLFQKIYNNNKEKEEEEEEEDEDDDNKENFQKTKLNVIDNGYDSTSLANSGNNNQQNYGQSNFNHLKNIYKYKKRNNELKSWNHVNFGNNQSSLSIITNNNNNINNINLNIDPMEISEKICTELYSFLISVKIENFNEKNCDINFLKDLAHSDTFDELKNYILSLKNISIESLALVPKNYYCFWLNIYNFLTIFSVIYKCEIISNSYEWYRFLKNSYFTIGNMEISLYEIETNIIREKDISNKIYGNIIDNEQLNLPNVEKFNSIINFGISLPTISSPSIRMYFPMNFLESLKLNSSLFFSNNLKIDMQNNKIEIPEYVTWIDPNFVSNMDKYRENLPQGFLKFVRKNPSFHIVVGKFDWKLSYINFKSSEIHNGI